MSKQSEVGGKEEGTFIKDVRTKGVGPKADLVREVAWI